MLLYFSKYYSCKLLPLIVTTSTILAAVTATNFSVLYPQTANAQEVSRGNGSVSIQLPNTGNQDDNWSCGPNSAARILAFYGHKINYGTVKSAINKDTILPPSVMVPSPTWKNPFGKRRVDIRTGTTPHALRDAMKKWEGNNVKLERKSDFSKLLRLLGEGKPVVALLRVGSIPPSQTLSGTWPAMHWVAINGFDEKNINFTDTNGVQYRYSYDEFQSKWDWSVGSGFASEALYKNGVQSKTMIWVDRTNSIASSVPSELIAVSTITPVSVRRVFIKSAHGNYFLDHNIAAKAIALADQRYNPTTGAYSGELWEIVNIGGGKVLIKSAHGNYFLDHNIAAKSIALADQPYNPTTGAYNGELWEIVDIGGGKVLIKSAHGNYFLDHNIAAKAIALADQPYNSATGAYDGELWEIVAR